MPFCRQTVTFLRTLSSPSSLPAPPTGSQGSNRQHTKGNSDHTYVWKKPKVTRDRGALGKADVLSGTPRTHLHLVHAADDPDKLGPKAQIIYQGWGVLGEGRPQDTWEPTQNPGGLRPPQLTSQSSTEETQIPALSPRGKCPQLWAGNTSQL